jgi:hypothetical protein
MNRQEIERLARKSGKTPREYCLDRIQDWKYNLFLVSDSYAGLDDDAFHKKVEQELEARRDD